jgi:hypothetical protein
MKPLDHPLALDDDESFAVWPFRRQLVDRFAQHDAAPPAAWLEDTQPFTPPWLAPAPPPARPGGLRFALPAALATFFVALAGTAAIANRDGVQQQLSAQIVPAAEAAPPPAVKRRPQAAHRAAARHASLFVPDVVGLKRQQAAALLGKKRFAVRVVLAKGKPGLVVAQKPKAATRLARPGRVVLTVGRPKPKPKPKRVAPPAPTPKVIVASVVGLSRPTAVAALRNLRLDVRVYAVPSAKPRGTVVAQSLRSGTRVESGSAIRVNVAG